MLNPQTNDLSDRELEILRLVATGVSNKEIAQKLYISSNTVKVHLRNIFTKIGANSRTEAAMYAVQIGLVETLAPSIPPDDGKSLLPDRPTQPTTDAKAAAGHPLSQLVRRPYFYLGVPVVIVVIAVLLLVFLRRNDNPTAAGVLPTSTPRVQWFELPGLPTPRQGLAVVNYDNQIFAIGGESSQGVSNVVERFNPQASSWIGLNPKPTAVTDISAAVIRGMIYVPGGKLASGLPTDKTEIYNPQTNQWSVGQPLPKPLSGYALAVFEGRIYVFGGWDGNQAVNDVYVFDDYTNAWATLPPMPTARAFAGAVVVDGSIYVIGGWDGKNALTTDEVYQSGLPDKDAQWTQAPPLPFGQYGMGVANLANIIFMIGGTESGQQLTTIALIPEETDWVRIDNPLKIGWSFLGATTIGTRLYALGGKTSEGLNNQMWSYQAIYTISLPIVR
jgi:DNA-binding CsgD family transcriptional regulator/N-acetylneuraminic acid mutarotase